MFKDPKLVRLSESTNSVFEIMAKVNGRPNKNSRLDVGRYEITHFNFNLLIEGGKWERDEYGVCDSYEQFMKDYGNPVLEKDKKNAYCVSFTLIDKKDQPEWGGWRWHKWGQYIGIQNPTAEYLYDEPEIDSVMVYSVFKYKK